MPTPGCELKNLRSDYLRDPLAVGSATPRLSWEMASGERGVFQSACQILVATSPERLETGKTDLWDSGRLETSFTALSYAGQPLAAGQRAWWTVRSWTASGEVTAFAAPAFWEMALLAPEDWSGASWIGADYTDVARPLPSPLFRRDVTLDRKAVRVRAYFCGLGYSELYLNGHKIGDQVLDPGQTDYDVYALYQTFDLTSAWKTGKNALGVILGDGWYNQDRVWKIEFTSARTRWGEDWVNQPREWQTCSYGTPGFLLKILIEFEDGARETVLSDGSWQYTLEGSLRSSNIYAGEVYDARREIAGWAESDFDASGWCEALVVPALSPMLRPQLMPPIRRTETLPVKSKHRAQPGVWIFDLGQNFAGWCRLKLTAPRGTEICLRFAEALDPHGGLDPLSTGTLHTLVIQTDRYFCRGEGEETWEPRFTYHGFQYVEVTGYPGEPPDDLLEGIVVHTALERTGDFICSDPLLNQLHRTALWTERSNLHSVPTDCPARERCGWLGDAHLRAETELCNFDAFQFLAKYQRDILNSLGRGEETYLGEEPDPAVPCNIAPGKRRCEQARPDWAVAMILVPWYLYLYSGDRESFSACYPQLRALVGFFERTACEGTIVEEGYGDFLPPPFRSNPNRPTDRPLKDSTSLVSTAYFYAVTKCVERFARELKHKADAAELEALAHRIRDAFIAKFYDAGQGTYGSQAADALALHLALHSEGEAARLGASLAADINDLYLGHFCVGVHGIRHLFGMLAESGQEGNCWNVLHVDGYPGFRHLFSLGATTFWETLYHPLRHSMRQERSRNHPFQGTFDAWFYHGIAGIAPDPAHPGFERVRLKPHLYRHLSQAGAVYHSVRGPIRSDWQVADGLFQWNVTLPANTRAEIHIPALNAESITESGIPIARVPGIQVGAMADGYCVCRLDNGSFAFQSPLAPKTAPEAWQSDVR